METLFKKYNVLLLLIIAIAIFFRVWNLFYVPPTASMDEASIGYNAYSVLKTGGDEFGQFPLISQRGYDDWRRSTYLLLVVPFVGFFGLNPVSIKLPSIILSVLTVLSTYYIVLHLFKKKSEFSEYSALVAAFVLAISPWHIYISRLGHESNACLSFLVFGSLFFLKGLKKATHLIFSVIFFILSMISYYSGQVFIPLFGVLLLILYHKEIIIILKKERIIRFAVVIFIAVLIPVLLNIFSPSSLTRFQGTSTFSQSAHGEKYNEMVFNRNKAVQNGDLIGEVVNNRRLYPLYVLLEGYFSHFNPYWLFTNPSGDSFKVPNLGLLYVWEIPFILAGIVFLIKTSQIAKREKILLFVWFLLGPLPASIATQTPHAMRSYNFLPTWQVFTSVGVVCLFYKLGKLKMVGILVLAYVIFFGILSLYSNYFYVFPMTQSKSFHYALGQTFSFVSSIEKNYSRIVFSNKDNLYQSYMLFLYYNKYDPYVYQKQGGTISGGYRETHTFAKYEFRPIKWEKESKNTLLVANQDEVPKNVARLFEGKYKDGTTGVIVVEK